MVIIKQGLSGCKIEIYNKNIVRKYSFSKHYNKRLNFQIEKQKFFSKNFDFKNISTPKIVNINENFFFHYFEMEYAYGLSYDKFFSSANINQVYFIINTLFNYFDQLIHLSNKEKKISINEVIYKKIVSLKKKSIYFDYLNFLQNILERKKYRLSKTFCHGDLTFANIIFGNEKLYFIDFLDSYIDNFIIDIVKLKQELFYYWNLEINNNNDFRIKQIYNLIWNKIKFRYKFFINSKEFSLIDTINNLRIEPYLKDTKQKKVLNKIIESSIYYEKFNHSNGG